MHLNEAMPLHAIETASSQTAGELIARLAHDALLSEVLLTPKPGLVDQRNDGAHEDMDLPLFVLSARTISPWFGRFVEMGYLQPFAHATGVLPQIRPIGIACEQAMFAATHGVNTHKGAIFSLGLMCTAVGRLLGRCLQPNPESVCQEVADICSGLEQELANRPTTSTAGERLFQLYGVTGVRGEAASGYATVRQYALPVYLSLRQNGVPNDTALLQALLQLMATNSDTNLLARGGPEGLNWVKTAAQALLREGGALAEDGEQKLANLDDEMIRRNLSPGGSADLLAVTCFLAGLPARNSSR